MHTIWRELILPDFEREDDWWRNGQNLYLDNMDGDWFLQDFPAFRTAWRYPAVLLWRIGDQSCRHILRQR
ncbi:hypothetical protein BU57_00165 [Escherichia coli O121:H19 str. 2011C-3609]|nr:hypothetical protein BU57_00165 [Escherichia coli O121:H19 str. 2011C-3609]